MSDPAPRPPGRRVALVWGLPGSVIGGALLGALLDRALGSSPWGTLGVALLAFAGIVVQLLRAPPE